MGKKITNIWVNAEDLNNDERFKQAQSSEFVELPVVDELANEETANGSTSRRDFLKYVGFGLGAATLASCETPVKRAIPYVIKPEEIVPGVANYYASAFVKGGDFVPVLVKTRDGRPIKIEGNPESSITGGGTSARAQASVLSLYDSARLREPSAYKVTEDKGISKTEAQKLSWEDFDKVIIGELASSSKIRVVSHTNMSPALAQAYKAFQDKYAGKDVKWVTYDPISTSALLDANQQMYNKRVVPEYHFDKAQTIVGIEADFLGTWISPVEYAHDYSKKRKLADKDIPKAEQAMSQHIQFESRMSLTGSNADNRVLIKPSEQALALVTLYNEVASLAGKPSISGPTGNFSWAKAAQSIKKTAKALYSNRSKGALVVCGINDVNMQMVVNGLNEMLGAYGNTITWEHFSNQRKGDDKSLAQLADELDSVDALIVLDANPAFDAPGMAATFAEKLPNVKTSIAICELMDETAGLCKYTAPLDHYLESWGDVEPKNGHYYIQQPTIQRIFNTRSAMENFLAWAQSNRYDRSAERADYEFLKSEWREVVLLKSNSMAPFQTFWDNAVHDGFVETKGGKATTGTTETTAAAPMDTTATAAPMPAAPAASSVSQAASNLASATPAGTELEVTFYETVNMGAGQYANNPWLQEMPDPVMRTTWDNFLSVPIEWDGNNNYIGFKNLQDGDVVTVNVNGVEQDLVVVRQFGQLNGTVSIGLGYGRKQAGKAGSNVGKDFFPAVKDFKYFATDITVSEKKGRDSDFASVQMHHTYGLTNEFEGEEINVDERVLGHVGFQGSLTNRSVIYQSTTKELKESLAHMKERREEADYLNKKTLYPGHEDAFEMGHHWGMAIDLNACIGCGACTVACMAENNVPVVGKHEVAIAHEMTWLRIDRYFFGEEETPNTVYQPMMCQHCDNAPCENVCPVAATNHSSEGLNQMTYNRCIGTRYCANNCPYKVRRFNWLDYTSADIFPWNEVDVNRGRENAEEYMYMTENLTRMVLNPDVTVRSRGVIEKCSFCVQRLQEGKLAAKVEGRKLEDRDTVVACQQACPTGAIVFGDRNNKKSEVVKQWSSERNYITLEETNVQSSVGYLMKVVNRDEEFTA